MFRCVWEYYSFLVDLNGWKLGFLICYDLEFPENTRSLALAGAELILGPGDKLCLQHFTLAQLIVHGQVRLSEPQSDDQKANVM